MNLFNFCSFAIIEIVFPNLRWIILYFVEKKHIATKKISFFAELLCFSDKNKLIVNRTF
jgi:hypothetical protein